MNRDEPIHYIDRFPVHPQSPGFGTPPPPELHHVLVGGVDLHPNHQGEASEAESDGNTRVWEQPTLRVYLRGEGQRALGPDGWDVYQLGATGRGGTIAATLAAAHPEQVSETEGPLPPHTCRELSQALLPTAAVVAVHRPSGVVCLLRDGCGFTCLYYAVHRSRLYFSTNLALLRGALGLLAVNTDKISEMLVFGHRGGGRSIWQGINVVAPGHLVVLSPQSRPRIESLHFPECLFDADERRRLERQPIEQTLAEVDAAVGQALQSLQGCARVAVPGGGGVDSSLLGAYLARQGTSVTFYSMNQPEAARREAEWIEPLTKALRVPCELVNIHRETFIRTLVSALKTSQHPLMGPNTVGGVLVQQQARERGEGEFVSGELCDTLFGGLSGFTYLSPRFRVLSWLSGIPNRYRFWLRRGLADVSTCCHEISRVVDGADLASVGTGCPERAESHREVQAFGYPGQSYTQRMADLLTLGEMKRVPGTLHHDFHERAETIGGRMHYPFADPRLIRLGLHLPYHFKRRRGHNKWLWRTFAAGYIGGETAFRKKYSFPTLTERWLDRTHSLLPRGFLGDLFGVNLGLLWDALPATSPTRWTLINCEIWGRLHVWNESPDALAGQLL